MMLHGTSESPWRYTSMETFDLVMIGTSLLGLAATLVMLWWTS
jgi:hypothetical protein